MTGCKALPLISAIIVTGATQAMSGRCADAAIYSWSGSSGATWSSSSTNWSSPTTGTLWDAATGAANVADFDVSGSSANVSGGVYANGLRFDATANVSGGTINLAAGSGSTFATPTITVSASGAAIGSNLAGSAGLILAGAGELSLSASNSNLTGGITVSSGTLATTGLGNVGNNSITLGSANTGSNNIDLRSSYTVGGTMPYWGTGNITVANSGTGTVLLDLGTQNANFQNNFVLNRATTVQSDATTGGAFFGNFANDNCTLTGTGALTLTATSGGFLHAALNGSGYSGAVTISPNSKVDLWFATYPLGTGPVTMQNGSNLYLKNVSPTVTDLSDAGAAGTTVTLQGFTLTVNSVQESTYGGIVSGSGSLIKTGKGLFVLSGANTYTGGTTVNGGTLVLDGAGSLQAGSALTIGSPGDGAVFSPPAAGHANADLAPVPEPGTTALFAVLWTAVACHRFSRRPASHKT